MPLVDKKCPQCGEHFGIKDAEIAKYELKKEVSVESEETSE